MANGIFGEQVIDHVHNTTHPDIRAYQNKIADNYFGVVEQLDHALAVRLHVAMKGENIPQSDDALIASNPVILHAPDPRDVSGPARHVNRYFDITDAVKFVAQHGTVTGIQRVQIELIRSIAKNEPHDAKFGIYLDTNATWRVVPLELFSALFSAHNGLRDTLLKFEVHALKLETPDFRDGDVMYFVGATWSISALFESLVELRKKGVSTVFYMHDVLPLERPDCFPAKHEGVFANWLQACLSNADAIVCNSNLTKAGLLNKTGYLGPVSVANLNVFPDYIQTYKDQSASTKQDTIASLGFGNSEYVLMVGTIEPRKNYVSAIHAWIAVGRALGAACPKLVIVGKMGWLSNSVLEIVENFRYAETLFFFKMLTITSWPPCMIMPCLRLISAALRAGGCQSQKAWLRVRLRSAVKIRLITMQGKASQYWLISCLNVTSSKRCWDYLMIDPALLKFGDASTSMRSLKRGTSCRLSCAL